MEKNHELVISDLKANNLLVLQQVHGTEIADADNEWELGGEPKADGMITTKENLALGIQTADCVPVLFATENGEYIGGLHCGWKTVLDGAIKIYKEKIRNQTDSELLALIGPSIQQASYEVGKEYMDNFLAQSENYAKFFIQKSELKYLFDLPGLVKYLLEIENIRVIKHFDEDTFQLPQKYPSNRYSNKNGLGKYKGSILSVIVKKS